MEISNFLFHSSKFWYLCICIFIFVFGLSTLSYAFLFFVFAFAYLHFTYFHICTLSSASLSLLLLIALAPNIAQAWKSHFNRNYPKYHNKTQIWNILNFHIRWSRQIGTFLNLKGPRDDFKFDNVHSFWVRIPFLSGENFESNGFYWMLVSWMENKVWAEDPISSKGLSFWKSKGLHFFSPNFWRVRSSVWAYCKSKLNYIVLFELEICWFVQLDPKKLMSAQYPPV